MILENFLLFTEIPTEKMLQSSTAFMQPPPNITALRPDHAGVLRLELRTLGVTAVVLPPSCPRLRWLYFTTLGAANQRPAPAIIAANSGSAGA